jgi:hypothetical protein
MSENYVFGFKLNMQSLTRLRGSKDTQFVEGLLKADSDSVKEIDDVFSDYADRPDERLTVAQALEEIVMNRLSKDHAYHYRRCLELLARRVGTELPDESRSRTLAVLQSFWPADLKPVLDLLGVKAIARLWLYDNVLFPWDNEAEAGEFEWPAATYYSNVVVGQALSEFGKADLRRMSSFDRKLYEQKTDDHDDVMADMRDAIRQLHEWVKEVGKKGDGTRSKAATDPQDSGDGLLIIVDGDQ